jgi:hypothetical protein
MKRREDRREKLINFSLFSRRILFPPLFSEQNGTYIYTKGLFSLLKGKTDRNTHTLFKLDNGASMYGRRGTMRDFDCTSPYLGTTEDYPEKRE